MQTLIENNYQHLGIELECYLEDFEKLITIETTEYSYSFYKQKEKLFLFKSKVSMGIHNLVGVYQFDSIEEANKKAQELQRQYLNV